MSPEQARGTKLDGRSDLYSVGIMLYEMLTGKTPYAETSKTSILGKLAFDQQEIPLPFPSDIPSSLQGVICNLLRRQRDERVSDADALAGQLHEILYTLPASPTVPTSSESGATVLVSQPSVANAPDKAKPDSPMAIGPGGFTETRAASSMATRSTRISPSAPIPRFPAPPPLAETTVQPAQPGTSDGNIKASPSAAPPPPPSPLPEFASLFPILAGGLVALLLLSGLVYYLATLPIQEPDAPRFEQVNAFPDQGLQSILERFRQAYENHDLLTIQSLSRISDDRLRNVQVMFANYETIQASIKDLIQTEQGASATLFLDSVTRAGGERVSLSPLARKFNLKIPRQGAEWGKIIW